MLKLEQCGFTSQSRPKDADGMANSQRLGLNSIDWVYYTVVSKRCRWNGKLYTGSKQCTLFAQISLSENLGSLQYYISERSLKFQKEKQEEAAKATPTSTCSQKQQEKVGKTLVRTPIISKKLDAVKETPVHSPTVNSRKQTAVQSPALKCEHAEKHTPVRTPVTNSRKQTVKHTPVHSPAVISKPESVKKTPVSSPVVKCKLQTGRQTPIHSPALNSVRQATKQSPAQKTTPLNKKLSGSGKRKASETLVSDRFYGKC